jgi:hypothetical protein
MKPTKLVSIQAYLRWVIAQYQTFQQQTQQDAYRIVAQEISKDGQCRLTIQVIGKSITFKAYPEEIAADDQMLERFSRKDVRTITYYACQEIKKPKARIIWHEFAEKLNKIVFRIKKKNHENLLEKTADQISLDKELIFTTGSEHVHQEKLQIKKLKDLNNQS